MNDKERAARALGYLEGMSAAVWSMAGEGNASSVVIAPELAEGYDRAVEELRRAVDWGDSDERRA